MQVIVWAGVVLFSFVLAYAEVILAKALGSSFRLEREGDTSVDIHNSLSENKALGLLIAFCFFLIAVITLYLLKLLFGGG